MTTRSGLFGGSLRSFLWGLGSGLLLGPMFLGAAAIGYLVGRGGGRFPAAAAGVGAGSSAAMLLFVKMMVSSGCPSCVDALITAPFTIAMIVGALGAGFALGRWSSRRAAARLIAAN